MSGTSKIEWTEATWNPFVGCTHVSDGCDHCYAASLASGRLAHTAIYGGLAEAGKFNGTVRLLPERLDWPLRKRKPLRIFVNSMSDLFHEGVPDEYIAKVFAVMAAARQHTFQVLTKRHGRMKSLLNSYAFREQVFLATNLDTGETHGDVWPLANVWLGVSVENQRWADIRIPALLNTPAAVRFLSCEPLLGPVDLVQSINRDPLAAYHFEPGGIDWVIVGGESGPGARAMRPEWAQALRDQCQSSGVAFLFKQWGEHVTRGQMTEAAAVAWDSRHGNDVYHDDVQWRVGKKAAGRELDGRLWDQYPEPVTAGA